MHIIDYDYLSAERGILSPSFLLKFFQGRCSSVHFVQLCLKTLGRMMKSTENCMGKFQSIFIVTLDNRQC